MEVKKNLWEVAVICPDGSFYSRPDFLDGNDTAGWKTRKDIAEIIAEVKTWPEVA